MRWAKAGQAWGNAKWHLANPDAEIDRRVRTRCGRVVLWQPTWLAEDRRPALARNNVCSACKKVYLASRPDLEGYFNRLNDKRDV